ncbi:hypothetical protein B0O99DRAFT_738106 [Bisporella sp. PMI_857]|nr:hypothetical protein B0O99DRAFT_738106 [Bisporella sp. PMI_857]
MTASPNDFSKQARMIWATLDDHIKAFAPLESTVSALATPIEQNFTNGGHTDGGYVQGYEVEDSDNTPDICELYACILRYARTLPWNDKAAHWRLIKVLTAFFARPEPPAPLGYKDSVLWRGSWFGSEVRDEWNFKPSVRPGKDIVEDSEEWTNLNAFMAYFTVEVATGNSWYGFRALAGLMEPTLVGGFELEIMLPSIAVWILIAGKVLYKAIKGQAGESSNVDSNPAGEFSLQHWEIWKKRFLDISADEKGGLKDATRKMAGDAAREMELIESS